MTLIQFTSRLISSFGASKLRSRPTLKIVTLNLRVSK
jgi:hypothetical protein